MLKLLLGLAARHALTFIGGLVGGAAAGAQLSSDTDVNIVVACLLTVGGVLWSIVQKRIIGINLVKVAAVIVVLILPATLLAGCNGNPATQATLLGADACTINAQFIHVLAGRRAAGQLSPAVIAAVDRDIAIADPYCNSPTAAAAASEAEVDAMMELAKLANGG